MTWLEDIWLVSLATESAREPSNKAFSRPSGLELGFKNNIAN